MVDDLDFDDLPPRGRAKPRRGRWGGARRSKKANGGDVLLTMVSPSTRRAARRKLEQVHGVTVSGRAGLAAIARAVSITLALPVPKDFAEASKLVIGFVAREVPASAQAAEARPFVPLSIPPEMLRALARTREAREVARSLFDDGEINRGVALNDESL